jgi:NAD(P)-dependent dehydrogenase (short-subunit alcohol dehydrogenase family)
MKIAPSEAAVLVTGCSSGIGRATAVHLATNGFTVFAAVRKDGDADALKKLNLSNIVPICPLDLTSREHIHEAVRSIKSRVITGGLSGLFAIVNNAGGGTIGPLELIDPDKLRQELEVRIVGSLMLVQELLPIVRQAAGRVVWIMTPAIVPLPYIASIHVCDFAANCLARTLEIELKPWKIPQVMVRCGGIKTAAVAKLAAELEEALQTWPRELFLPYEPFLLRWKEEMEKFDTKRTDPDEVGRVVFKALCSARPRRRYMVGHMARAAAFLEWLPQVWVDFILKKRF